ncbi:rho hypothetical protein [Limosa lapponica baueri]|uniref:Uncharacterized protein n=1 Tax=Limosa lapponica baueri TaxID=1758121 RepID=A0A2I0T4T1_LIMLA|nr:rho hypothetical protein [Limosa lapponica baueri]
MKSKTIFLLLFNFSTKGTDNLENSDKLRTSEPAAKGTPAKVNPYSVINISPIQDKDPSSSPEPSPQDECASPNLSGGYSVPVPCGYAVPSNLPLILPAYSSPVIIRSVSVDEEDPDEVIYDDVPRENSDSEPGLRSL